MYLSRIDNLVQDQAEQYVRLDHHILCRIHLSNNLNMHKVFLVISYSLLLQSKMMTGRFSNGLQCSCSLEMCPAAPF